MQDNALNNLTPNTLKNDIDGSKKEKVELLEIKEEKEQAPKNENSNLNVVKGLGCRQGSKLTQQFSELNFRNKMEQKDELKTLMSGMSIGKRKSGKIRKKKKDKKDTKLPTNPIHKLLAELQIIRGNEKHVKRFNSKFHSKLGIPVKTNLEVLIQALDFLSHETEKDYFINNYRSLADDMANYLLIEILLNQIERISLDISSQVYKYYEEYPLDHVLMNDWTMIRSILRAHNIIGTNIIYKMKDYSLSKHTQAKMKSLEKYRKLLRKN